MSPSSQDAKEIISKSGNNFHCKVLKYFKEKGWNISISPYYNDNVSEKPREIDLIAEKDFEWNEKPIYTGRDPGRINVRLFIECKYVAQVTVFWFHSKDIGQAKKLVFRTTPLSENNIYTDKHHYLQDKDVAKLFASSKSDKSTENEIIYKALNQSLNAMVYFRTELTGLRLLATQFNFPFPLLLPSPSPYNNWAFIRE